MVYIYVCFVSSYHMRLKENRFRWITRISGSRHKSNFLVARTNSLQQGQNLRKNKVSCCFNKNTKASSPVPRVFFRELLFGQELHQALCECQAVLFFFLFQTFMYVWFLNIEGREVGSESQNNCGGGKSTLTGSLGSSTSRALNK